MKTSDQLERFNRFATTVISQRGENLTLDELWDRWRLENPTEDEAERNLLAVKAALDDMRSGDRGVAAGDHINELRKKYQLPTG